MTDSEPHWYFQTHIECPLCMSCRTYRERRFEPKPDDPAMRHDHIIMYDYCEEAAGWRYD